jgi:predicted nucleotidyltransferase
VLRPILACCWIEATNTIPPMEFDRLADAQLPKGTLSDEVARLLERKRAGQELDIEPQIKVINDFLEQQLKHFDEVVELIEQRGTTREMFDDIFRATLSEVWGESYRFHR